MIKTRFGGESDYLYYDISIFNNTEEGIATNYPLSFIETRPEDFIERCSNYYLSVVRFNLQLSNLPVFIPKIKSNQSNINLTIYNLILRNGATYLNVPVIWETQNVIVPTPISPVISQQFSEYYFCYSFDHFLKLINKAITDSGVFGVNLCYFQLNPSSNNIELITSSGFYGSSPTLEIGFNDPLKNLFSTMNFNMKLTPPALLYPYNYYYNIEFPANQVVYNSTLSTYIVSSYTCPLALWNPVSSLVFTSSTIPVVQNAVGPEKFFNTSRLLPSQENSNNVLNIITDFEVNIGQNSFYSPSVSYLPTAEYRLINMFGNSGLNQVQINVYWKDNFGGLHLINLGNNCVGNIKLMFVKKKLMN